jgi:hypothetical protein
MAKKSLPKIKKIVLTHPRTGREIEIDIAVYQLIKAAILQSLKGSKGKTFTGLTDDVVLIVRKKTRGFNRSVPWYTISILLDLETRGISESFTEKGRKLNRLK